LKYIENLQQIISGAAFLNQALDKIRFGSKLGQKPKNWTGKLFLLNAGWLCR
jgi:hypothetical protein